MGSTVRRVQTHSVYTRNNMKYLYNTAFPRVVVARLNGSYVDTWIIYFYILCTKYAFIVHLAKHVFALNYEYYRASTHLFPGENAVWPSEFERFF